MEETYRKQNFDKEQMLELSRDLVKVFKKRRTIRHFSSEKIDIELIENAIEIASRAPSGANKQPWSFVLVSNSELKHKIREKAELEETSFYKTRPNEKWLKDLAHLQTNEVKEFLTECPYLIVVFYKNYNVVDGVKQDVNYYAKESVGIATGMLISSLHLCGLCSLTYTPTHMQFLPKLLNRPTEEKAFMVLGVGHCKEGAKVPVISKKSKEDILHTYH